MELIFLEFCCFGRLVVFFSLALLSSPIILVFCRVVWIELDFHQQSDRPWGFLIGLLMLECARPVQLCTE
ncbi:hypothetical protein BDW42DRAFT_175663 [Aspergillus taichungensis]|uniref:Uncharacterized protein n=1 Tax=Aspergillus taichungensis TaxID=482145 RepID=A0A2J5HLJ8_9EURO|nr:hypothetical protein BDW42DRAFT_175663 [Aspergillus taichungensis]